MFLFNVKQIFKLRLKRRQFLEFVVNFTYLIMFPFQVNIFPL